MINNLEQGHFGIGIQNGKTPENICVLWRSIQNRYEKQSCDYFLIKYQ